MAGRMVARGLRMAAERSGRRRPCVNARPEPSALCFAVLYEWLAFDTFEAGELEAFKVALGLFGDGFS